MKGMFPEYEHYIPERVALAWRRGLFVFDTNVLLNLYRYQATTRDELINVLGQLSSRIWVPHHVALEFQRNRLKVIADQNRRFADVRRTVEKARLSLFGELDKLQLQKRHSLIDPNPLTAGFDALVNTFLTQLETLRENQQALSGPDPLKDKIEEIFRNHVGAAPVSQDAVDATYKEAEWRFKMGIPPGYEDADKDKDRPDEHFHGGILYKRKFADHLLWRQITAHTKERSVKELIFVTDDGKADWWLRIDVDGAKTIGPRPELVEDARSHGSVETFLMYNPEGFLKYAREFLRASVSEETLKDVRDVSIRRSAILNDRDEFRNFALRAERAVFRWLAARHETVEPNRRGFPDFIARSDGKLLGFEVRVVRNAHTALFSMREALYRAFYEVERKGFAEMTLIVIARDAEAVDEVKLMSAGAMKDKMPSNIKVLIGVLDLSDGNDDRFMPLDELHLDMTEDA